MPTPPTHHTFDAVVVGSGAAGLACACRIVRELERAGVPGAAARVALVTRGLGLGASNQSGSDKQTYYKLGAGSEPDSPRELAETLAAGGCMHGDVALAEATASLRAFHQLVELGVPFPHDAWGAFVGYKTDHDPRRRATSAGPLTSHYMVQGWLAELRRLGIRVFDHHHLLAVVTGREKPSRTGERGRSRSGVSPRVARGVLCANLRRLSSPGGGLVLFRASSVVVAGGGPGELYAQSVFPRGQMGPYAALLEAGAEACNLTELQFGIASLRPRWNLSGTYQQVVPRYYSTDARGGDEREFLSEHFPTMGALATAIFLKGYQWPFDPGKVRSGGSSLVDALVYEETVRKGRRVFMDFRENPRPAGSMKPFSVADLSPEAREYLERSGATQATPIARLAHMNPPSIDLYRAKGVDLAREPLEIAVCAQHCNGGFAVDAWWETSVARLFAIGEIAGTHGVKRPGGSALNAGQVGALRAAQRIAHVYVQPGAETPASEEAFLTDAEPCVRRVGEWVMKLAAHPTGQDGAEAEPTAEELRRAIQRRMSAAAGILRSASGVARALAEAGVEWRACEKRGWRLAGGARARWFAAWELRELALAQRAFLEALRHLIARGGGSRGSYLITSPQGRRPLAALGAGWAALPENQALRQTILGLRYDARRHRFVPAETAARPIPEPGDPWFETVWSDFRTGRIFGASERS